MYCRMQLDSAMVSMEKSKLKDIERLQVPPGFHPCLRHPLQA